MVSNVLRNRFISASEIRSQLKEVRNVKVSLKTVRRMLAERNLKAFRLVRAPQLLPQNRSERLRFAQEHADWTMHQCSNVLFSDETRISLIGPDDRHRVYRRPNERFSPCTIVETVSFQGGSIMLRGGISYEARADLVVLERGVINVLRYLEAILEPHVILFAPFIEMIFFLCKITPAHTS